MDVTIDGHRRIVTGHNPQGRSMVVHDGMVPPGSPSDVNLWRSSFFDLDGLPPPHLPFYPKDSEVFCRFVHLPPDQDTPLPEDARQELSDSFFRACDIEECRIDTSRHPLMHQTPTVDIIVVLSGNVSLVLDEGDPIPLKPLDTIIQRATNHAWHVKGPDPALLLSVMLGQTKETKV